jgi:hypothetical protein
MIFLEKKSVACSERFFMTFAYLVRTSAYNSEPGRSSILKDKAIHTTHFLFALKAKDSMREYLRRPDKLLAACNSNEVLKKSVRNNVP